MDGIAINSHIALNLQYKTHGRIQKVFSVRGGPTLTMCFFFYEGRKDPNKFTISRPSSARQRNAI